MKEFTFSFFTIGFKKSLSMISTPNVLAHVMVHKVTHTLRKANSHSAAGIMKANWTDDDYKTMRMKPLPFTDMDIRLIRSGMANLCAKAP